MAIDPKLLQKLMSHPELMGVDDLDLEQSGEALAPDESTPMQPMEEMPMDDMEGEESDLDGEEIASTPPMDLDVDSDITAKLKKLKLGQSLDDMSEQEEQDIASDTQAPTDLRKKALERIKEKYLGKQ